VAVIGPEHYDEAAAERAAPEPLQAPIWAQLHIGPPGRGFANTAPGLNRSVCGGGRAHWSIPAEFAFDLDVTHVTWWDKSHGGKLLDTTVLIPPKHVQSGDDIDVWRHERAVPDRPPFPGPGGAWATTETDGAVRIWASEIDALRHAVVNRQRVTVEFVSWGGEIRGQNGPEYG
jgi:hypothetical protein